MPGGKPEVALQIYGGVPPVAWSVVAEYRLCTAAIGDTVSVRLAVAAGAGLMISPKLCELCAGVEELSVTVIVEPEARSPIPVTNRLKVDPLGAGFLAELIE
jgi:hypothetical protein